MHGRYMQQAGSNQSVGVQYGKNNYCCANLQGATCNDMLHCQCTDQTVIIFMPVFPLAVASMLACARIGAVHSVVFSTFSAMDLRKRILDGKYGYLSLFE